MTKSRIVGQLVCVFLLALALAATGTQGAYAQGGSGQIKGIVTDPTGAVVPGAKIQRKIGIDFVFGQFRRLCFAGFAFAGKVGPGSLS